MNKKLIFPLLLGIVGVVILLWLGVWQMQRLAGKQDVLAQIESQINKPPVVLPMSPNVADHKFLAVEVQGHFNGPEIHVLASRKYIGPGYKVISALTTTDNRRILVDRGFIRTSDTANTHSQSAAPIRGNLHWPDETDGYTPAPDLAANIWFARDVDALADALNTEPVLLQASSDTGGGVEPFPVDTNSIPNDHLNYAITWFLLAAVWFGMTVFLVWRIKRQTML